MQTEQRRLGELSGPEAEALADRFQQSCKRVLGAARGSRD